jgi:hypothetical protein
MRNSGVVAADESVVHESLQLGGPGPLVSKPAKH